MRSPRSAGAAWAVYAVLAATAGSAATAPAPALPVAPAASPTTEQIDLAASHVRQDPDMGIERKARTLKWKSADDSGKAREPSGLWLWLQGLFTWLAASARLVVWVLAALLAACIAVFLLRLLRSRAAAARAHAFAAPSHVRDLDIRPESLPADIGATALQLWESGEQRRALALLYRGLLSRMVHAYRAPVRDSTTEGECIVLARLCLPATGSDFANRLVTTWQLAVYGDRIPATDQVRALCSDFAPSLDPVGAGGSVST